MNTLDQERGSHLRAIDESLRNHEQNPLIAVAKTAGSLSVEAFELARYGTRALAERLHIVRK